MNGFDNSPNTTSEEESMSDNEKMFLYARAVHSNHSIQYHTDNGATKGDQRVQKHDDGRIGSDSIRVQSASISSSAYLPNHQYD